MDHSTVQDMAKVSFFFPSLSRKLMSHVTTAAASRHKGYCAPHAFGIAVHVNPKPMVRNVLAGISEASNTLVNCITHGDAKDPNQSVDL